MTKGKRIEKLEADNAVLATRINELESAVCALQVTVSQLKSALLIPESPIADAEPAAEGSKKREYETLRRNSMFAPEHRFHVNEDYKK